MTNMQKFAAQQLTKKQMNNVNGGQVTTKEEYCDTLFKLVLSDYARDYWTPEEWDNAGTAIGKHCIN